MDLAFIAPYQNIKNKAKSIIETNRYPAQTYLGNLQDGVVAARQAMADGAHIIISRGGTARLIREQLDIEVIEVGASYFKLLSYVFEETSESSRIAIVGFRQFLNLAQPVCDILKREHRVFEIEDGQSMEEVFEAVVSWQPDVVIGDAVSVITAQQYSINYHLIESSMETIVDAFERGMLVLNNLKRHIASAQKLGAVLNCTKEGAMLVNCKGIIEETNQKACAALNMLRVDIINQPYTHFFQSKELDAAASTMQTEKNILMTINSKRFATDYIVISPESSEGTAVIRFQQVEKIQETGNIIQKKLRDKGFYAKYVFSDIVHQCPEMKQLIEVARQYSRSTSNIMLQGETGTGKELFAQSIHNTSPLVDGPFVAVNCAALTGSLLESELFGYAPGAFTGALRSGKNGLFELAHGGTLFLDEITEMDIYLQSKLLRALQSHEIMRIGDNKIIPINVRVISATNKNPLEEVKTGHFRADLFYRLNVLDLQIPSLRDRRGDIGFLFKHYLKVYLGRRNIAQIAAPSQTFSDALSGYDWPGNVRELENIVEKYVSLQGVLASEQIESIVMKSLEAESVPGRVDETASLDEIVKAVVSRTYQLEGENISKTAERLKVDRNTVKRWLKKALPEN